MTFLHFAEMEDGRDPIPGARAFQQFREGIAVRCDEAPVVTELRVIGSFGLFGS